MSVAPWVVVLSVLALGSIAGIAVTSTMLVANHRDIESQPATVPCDWINATLQLSEPSAMYFDPTNATWDPSDLALPVETRRSLLAAGKSSSRPSSSSSSSRARTTSTGMPAPRSYTRTSDGSYIMLGSYYLILSSSSSRQQTYTDIRNEVPMTVSQCQGTVAPINATYIVPCDYLVCQEKRACQDVNGSYLRADFRLVPAPTTMDNPKIAELRGKDPSLIAGLCVSSVTLLVASVIAIVWFIIAVGSPKRQGRWKTMLGSDGAAFADLERGVVSDSLVHRVRALRKERGPYISDDIYAYFLSVHGFHRADSAQRLLRCEDM